MTLKKISVITIFTVILITLFMRPSFAAGNMDYASDAPGGNVTNADEFVAALGKDNAVKVSEKEKR